MLPCRYVKFDTFHPAVDRGLPVTRVISRVILQQLLAETAMEIAGEDVILNDQNVIDYEHVVWRLSAPAFFVLRICVVVSACVRTAYPGLEKFCLTTTIVSRGLNWMYKLTCNGCAG